MAETFGEVLDDPCMVKCATVVTRDSVVGSLLGMRLSDVGETADVVVTAIGDIEVDFMVENFVGKHMGEFGP